MDWLDPLNKLIFQQAFKHKQTSVKDRDGRTFDLTYGKFKPPVTEEFETVTVKLRNAVVPRGTFKLKEVTRIEWLAGEKAGDHK